MGKKKTKELKTLIAIPCFDTVHSLFCKSILGLQIRDNTQFGFAMGSLIYDARNQIVGDAINKGHDRIFWIDSDMVFQPDLLERLHATMDKTKADMVTALCFSRKPPLVPVIYSRCDVQQTENGPEFHVEKYLDYPENSVFPIAASGMAATLMTTDLAMRIIEKFGTAFAPLPGFGEDLSFCLRANDIGAKIVCDSSIKVDHLGLVTFGEDDYRLLREEARHE